MTCTISSELEQQLAAEAAHRQTTVDQIVEVAVREYLDKSPDSDGESSSQDLGNDEWLRTFRELQRSLAITEETAKEWRQAIIEGRR